MFLKISENDFRKITAENEPAKNLQNFQKKIAKLANFANFANPNLGILGAALRAHELTSHRSEEALTYVDAEGVRPCAAPFVDLVRKHFVENQIWKRIRYANLKSYFSFLIYYCALAI